MPDDDDNIRPFKPKRGKPRPASHVALSHELRHNPALHSGRLFSFDTFAGETLLQHPIPRPGVTPAKTWEVVDTTDVHVIQLTEFFEDMGFTKVNPAMVNRVIAVEADRNQFSSGRRALEALPEWDGVHRLEKFFPLVCGAPEAEDGMSESEVWRRDRYLRAVARCFFIGIVRRIMEPGCKLDTMVVLEGEQGIGKSTLLRVLAFEKEEWFTDSIPDNLTSRDARAHLRGKMIVELAELTQLKATRADSVKQFLSAQDDKIRLSYGKRDVMLKRSCSFVGTTNAFEYLQDYTGNRRYYPVRCGEINIALAREQLPQLYAEALEAYWEKEPHWLPKDVEAIAEEEQTKRLQSDPWEHAAREFVDKRKTNARGLGEPDIFIRTDEVLDTLMAGKVEKWDHVAERRVHVLLRKLGGKNKVLRRSGRAPSRGWWWLLG